MEKILCKIYRIPESLLWLNRLVVVKSTAMLIGSRQRICGKTLNVSIQSTVSNQVESVQYLGVIKHF